MYSYLNKDNMPVDIQLSREITLRQQEQHHQQQ